MAGITSYGAYVPIYRLSRDKIAQAWGGRSMGGEKAVANYDEDSLTMAVAAGIDCINGFDRINIDGLFFATTTSHYKEKQSATTIALALDLPRAIRTAEFTNSLRAGTNALGAAVDAVKSGSSQSILMAASDCRLGAPKGQFEQLFGDGAAAVLIGDSGVIASIEDSFSIANEILDIWKEESDPFIKFWEDRFIISQGYQNTVYEAVSTLIKKNNLTSKDFTKAILCAPNPRAHAALASSLGFDPRTQVQDPMLATVGNTGVSSVLMMLIAALEEANPGDKLLLASYGDGADAYILQVTDEIKNLKATRGIRGHLKSKMELPSYEMYLEFRQLIPTEKNVLIQTVLGVAPAIWRERRQNITLCGSKCKKCRTPQYPKQRICAVCQTKDEFEEYRFSDRRGKLFTFAHDFTSQIPNPPLTYGFVDFEGGGRMLCEIVDCDIRQIEIGIPLEMTFRRMRLEGAIHDYFWKGRPIR